MQIHSRPSHQGTVGPRLQMEGATRKYGLKGPIQSKGPHTP
jgi:hypothetical protein